VLVCFGCFNEGLCCFLLRQIILTYPVPLSAIYLSSGLHKKDKDSPFTSRFLWGKPTNCDNLSNNRRDHVIFTRPHIILRELTSTKQLHSSRCYWMHTVFVVTDCKKEPHLMRFLQMVERFSSLTFPSGVS